MMEEILFPHKNPFSIFRYLFSLLFYFFVSFSHHSLFSLFALLRLFSPFIFSLSLLSSLSLSLLPFSVSYGPCIFMRVASRAFSIRWAWEMWYWQYPLSERGRGRERERGRGRQREMKRRRKFTLEEKKYALSLPPLSLFSPSLSLLSPPPSPSPSLLPLLCIHILRARRPILSCGFTNCIVSGCADHKQMVGGVD